MVALPMTPQLVAIGLVLLGVLLAAVALRLLSDRRRDRAAGALVAIDAGAPMTLRSERYRIAGRPDELRRLPDGRLLPIELKSRASPPAGPPRSHLVQVWAYCLLVEETTGRAPPYGLVRYSDGGEFRIAWDRAARAELLALRAELDRPYDGRATPSRAKCARCRWAPGCDARATGR
jgi:CRISPR-associated exonuclease Cas4